MNWQGFIDKWPGAAADFLRGLENHKHRFCAAYTHQHMVLMQTRNSVAESGNSSIHAFMNENKPHSELVQTLLQHDAEHNNRDRRKLFLKHQQLPDIMRDTSPQQVRDCLETFSDTMTEKYKEQLEDSYNYYCLHSDGEKGVYEVCRKNHPLAPRQLRMDPVGGQLECLCLFRLSSGICCRHILCVLAYLRQPLFNRSYFDARWQRRTELPCTEAIARLLSEGNGPSISDFKDADIRDAVAFESTDIERCGPVQGSKGKLSRKRTQLENNFQKFMAAVRPLGEYVQTSSELTDLACNAINVLFSNIRTCPDQVAACATSSGVSRFYSFDTTNTDPMAGTIIQGKSALRLPGPQKCTRIVGQGERFKKQQHQPTR